MTRTRLAFVTAFSLFGSQLIGTHIAAWWYGNDPALGSTFVGKYYGPWKLAEWTWRWGAYDIGILVIAGASAVLCLLFFCAAFLPRKRSAD